MSCCGRTRIEETRADRSVATAPAPEPVRTVVFEYIGRTSLTIVGPVTRMSYRFDKPGARATVFARDRHSLNLVPVLKQVSA